MCVQFWASPFCATYNLPALNGQRLVLDRVALAKIFVGNITRWNDPLLIALNPPLSHILPNEGITVVLQADPFTFIKEFTRASTLVDEQFASLVGFTSYPKWPRHRYHRWASHNGTTGPTSFVMATPNSIAIAMVVFVKQMGSSIASMRNQAGVTVQPSFQSTDAAFRELGVSSQRTIDPASGTAVQSYSWTGSLTNAPGAASWPYVLSSTLVIPRTHSRGTCRSRSELSKFLIWMLRAPEVRSGLGVSELSCLLSDEMDLQLGVSLFLGGQQGADGRPGMSCAQQAVNSGDFEALEINGADMAVGTRPPVSALLQMQYNQFNSFAGVHSHVMDENLALRGVIDPNGRPDMLWLLPASFRILYPGRLERRLRDDSLTLLPAAVHAVLVQFTLPAVAKAELVASGQALHLDLETVGAIFAGEITRWLDPRLVTLNPLLPTLSAADPSLSSLPITLVLCGRNTPPGGMDGAHAVTASLTLSNHLLLALNHTQAFRSLAASSGVEWSLPANFSALVSRLTAGGVGHQIVASESDIPAAVSRTPGAIGIALAFQNVTDPSSYFHMLRAVVPAAAIGAVTPSPYSARVAPLPANFLACATASPIPPSLGDFSIEASLTSTAEAAAQCWPMSFLQSLAVAQDAVAGAHIDDEGEKTLGADGGTAATMLADQTALCVRRERIAKFVQWISLDQRTVAPSIRWGRMPLLTSPALRPLIETGVRGLRCGGPGQTILWKAPVVWEISSGLYSLGLGVGCAGVWLAVAVAVFLVRNRSRTIIRSASLGLQSLSLTGMVFLFLSSVTFVFPATSQSCTLLAWALTLGVSLTYTGPCLKLIRVHRAASGRKLKSVRMSDVRIGLLVLLLVAIDALLLGVAQADSGSALLVPVEHRVMEDSRDHVYATCSVPSSALVTGALLAALHASLLVVSAWMAFQCRHVSSAFGESANLSWSVWNTLLSTVVVAAVTVLATDSHGDVYALLLLFLLNWCALSTLVFSFGHKFVTLLTQHIEQRRQQQSYNNSSRSGFSNTSGRGSSHGSQHSATGSASGSFGSMGGESFHLPDLNTVFSLPLLERYLSALELHLEQAYARRATISEGAVLSSKPSKSAIALNRSRPPNVNPAPVAARSGSSQMHWSPNASFNALADSRVEAFVAPLQSPVAAGGGHGQRAATAATSSGLQQRGRASSMGSGGGSFASVSGSGAPARSGVSPTLKPYGPAPYTQPATSSGAAAAAAASIATAAHASSSRVPLRIAVSGAGPAPSSGSLRVSPVPSHAIVRRRSDGRPFP